MSERTSERVWTRLGERLQMKFFFLLIVVMKKHGSNTENISRAVLRLGTKLWWLRAPLTFLHAASGFELQTL